MGDQYDLLLGQSKNRVSLRNTWKKIRSGESAFSVLGSVGNIGFSIVVPILIALYIGIRLDEIWNIKPVVTLSLLSVGLVFSLFGVYRSLKKLVH